MRRYPFEPDYAVPPGETLLETLAALGLTIKDLARTTGLTPKVIEGIIDGRIPITPEKAVLLEQTTGVPANFWSNLDANYRKRSDK